MKDLDGDGVDDFLTGHLHAAERNISFVVFGSAEPLFRTTADLSAGRGGFGVDGAAESFVSPGDLDGDGRSDLVFGGVGRTDSFYDEHAPVGVTRVLFETPARRTSTVSGSALLPPSGLVSTATGSLLET